MSPPRQYSAQSPLCNLPREEGDAAQPCPIKRGATLAVSRRAAEQLSGALPDREETAVSALQGVIRKHMDVSEAGVFGPLALQSRSEYDPPADQEPGEAEDGLHDDDDDELAASCLIVIRQENPSYLLGKGKVRFCSCRCCVYSVR